MNLLGCVWITRRPQASGPELPKDGVDVLNHHGDHRPCSAVMIREKNQVSFPGEHAEPPIRVRVIPLDVLEIEDLCVELESLTEPAASDTQDDRPGN